MSNWTAVISSSVCSGFVVICGQCWYCKEFKEVNHKVNEDSAVQDGVGVCV